MLSRVTFSEARLLMSEKNNNLHLAVVNTACWAYSACWACSFQEFQTLILLAYGLNGGLPNHPGPVFSYKLRYIVGFWLVEMAISTNQKPTVYRNLYENTGPVHYFWIFLGISRSSNFFGRSKSLRASPRPNAGWMVIHRLRRWTNIKPTLVQRLVCSSYVPKDAEFYRTNTSVTAVPCMGFLLVIQFLL